MCAVKDSVLALCGGARTLDNIGKPSCSNSVLFEVSASSTTLSIDTIPELLPGASATLQGAFSTGNEQQQTACEAAPSATSTSADSKALLDPVSGASSLQHQVSSGLTAAAISAAAAAATSSSSKDTATSAASSAVASSSQGAASCDASANGPCAAAKPAKTCSGSSNGNSSSSSSAADINTLAAAVAASKLGLLEQLTSALESSGVATARDCDGRSCLHYAAGYGNEECVDLLLERGADAQVADGNGEWLRLHWGSGLYAVPEAQAGALCVCSAVSHGRAALSCCMHG